MTDAELLQAYKDTGLEPEELQLGLNAAVRKKVGAEYYGLTPDQMDRAVDLFQADAEGRLVVLPCKVGDTVYFRTYTKNATVDLGIQPHEVAAIRAYAMVRGEFSMVGMNVDQFGKTVFLTREEAEKALEGGKSDGQ